MRQVASLVALNRGLVSRLGLARIDIKRVALGAETMTNWMPRVLGAMSLRVGLRYVFNTLTNQACRNLKFIFATDDTALLELTPRVMRISINDVLLERPAVASAVVNGDFTASLASWTDNDDAGCTSQWVAPGYMEFVGTGSARAVRDQTVVCANPNIEHALRIVIARGPVTVRIGSTVGGDDYLLETVLHTGNHSLSFTPIGNFSIRFFSTHLRKIWVESCNVEPAGVVILPTPWEASDLQNIRIDQSADVIFVACTGFQQRRIERRGTHPHGRSWSVALYSPTDGPFQVQNVGPITMLPSALTGNITLDSSLAYFRAEHVNGLFSLTSLGQEVSAVGAANGVFTPSIRVTGIGNARVFSVVITGNATGSQVDLQRSYDNATWGNVGGGGVYLADVTVTVNDSLDNQIVYYRLFITTRVAPDVITMTERIGSGSVRGVVRVTDFVDANRVAAEVLISLGGTTANTVWQEGQWSDVKGWPTAVGFHEGRLWWAGINGIWGSVSDAYDSFDETVIGDSAPLNRTVGSGPVDTINWILSMRGMMLGAQGAELSARSSSLDEPLTPSNFNIKTPSTQGSGAVPSAKVDQSGYFVNRSGCKVFELSFDVKNYDYSSNDLMALVPELGVGGIVRIDVQRQPDTRLHCVRSDGVALVLVVDKVEEVLAWVVVETDGFVEDVLVLPALPGDIDDQVYYVVRRTINGAVVRFQEKWSQELDCRGGQLCELADAHVSYTGIPTQVIHAPHLEGEEVVVWADGVDVGTDDSTIPWTQRYTVTGGQVNLPVAASNIVAGLGYRARYKSTKLGQQSQAGSPLNQQKKVGKIGIIAADIHPKGVRFGPDFDHLDDMPEMEAAALVSGTTTDYDEEMIPFPGTWNTDTRVCMQAQAPRSATILGITPDLEVHG